MNTIKIININSSIAILFASLCQLSSLAHAEQYSNCSDLKVGDIVEMYRHWDYENQRYNNFQSPRFFGTQYRILELNSKSIPPMAKVQLIKGEENDPHFGISKPGMVNNFMSSGAYKAANPNSTLQFCDEYKKVK